MTQQISKYNPIAGHSSVHLGLNTALLAAQIAFRDNPHTPFFLWRGIRDASFRLCSDDTIPRLGPVPPPSLSTILFHGNLHALCALARAIPIDLFAGTPHG